jgi:tetratricopeptide (TPR) repeat protein
MIFPPKRHRWLLVCLSLLSHLAACSSEPSPVAPQPPSPAASPPRLAPAPPWQLCDRREVIGPNGGSILRVAWGDGEELILNQVEGGRERSYHLFFDDRGRLVGYVGILPKGLDLASQPEYAAWITKQKPTDFLLPAEVARRLGGPISGRLYTDQGDRINGRAVVIPQRERQMLYVYSYVLTPYATLLTPYKSEYLERLQAPIQTIVPPGTEKNESSDYKARQQFAKGEVAQFALCGTQDVDVAVEAYQRAIEIGLAESLYQAEAHHRLGLAYRDKGELQKAVTAIESSLKIRPSIPEVVNHLGKVYALMGDTAHAVEAFHRAIGLKPNYAIAHFNLAEAVDAVDPRRALTAYENYLAYVDPTPGEQERIAKARERVRAIRKSERL